MTPKRPSRLAPANWIRYSTLPIALALSACAATNPEGVAYPPARHAAVAAELAKSAAQPAAADAAATRAAAIAQPPVAATQAAIETPPPPVQAIDPLSPGRKVDLEDRSVRIDLWERLRNGFAIPDLETEIVRDREQWYASRPDYVQRMTERGSRYLFHIVEEVERRRLPTELALLPFIESAFNPQALSSANASGMWQFIPSTGKYFDLTQNIFRDDRRDVLASTKAALDYLEKLHRMFGDWRLALAAYNWGEGSVQRAIARNERDGLATDYLSLRMPLETQHYVPKLQAVKNIIARPQHFGLSLPPLENHPYFLSIPIERDIDVDVAARLAGMSLADFKALNPQMNKPVILAAGTPQLLLPYDNANEFVRRHREHKGPLATWTAWVAPKTMRPRDVAQEHGMNETALRELNRIPPRMLIKAGSTLLVPRLAQRQADVSEQIADNAMMTLAPDVPPLRRLALRAGKRDTVAGIAKRYRVSESQVAAWNKTTTQARFRTGQTIFVYVPTDSGSRVAGSSGSPSKVAVSASKPSARKTASRVAGKSRPDSERVAGKSSKGSRVAQSGKNPLTQIKY
ncbi:transglycosylase SLT domain-containing protein [Piscinibacter sakaiensis]|uniref:transglycosylase SLT domain-containing protein n=1 Tax=Piscinibacter sakaiensis TaxID=1547922 RepID=UPI003AAFF9A3